MTYNPQVEKWYCAECYRDLPANLKPDWEPDYPLTEAQIKEFFKQLNRRADRCGATFRQSREVLQGMDISRADQIKFINICKEYGGYNE